MVIVTGCRIDVSARTNLTEYCVNLLEGIVRFFRCSSTSRGRWDYDSLKMDEGAFGQTDWCRGSEYPVFENCIDVRHLGTFSCEVVWSLLLRILAGTEDALIREEP